MRFRLIEKDMGGMANVGLKDQHIQGKEDDVTTSDSKTYIGSNAKRKLAMNKIKHTKIGDDIHYYINGVEGRGIVIKMANEYLEVFKEDGQLGTIHINDTFFVKDILINKQWDDMEDDERYEALIKIHAPSPRYITKRWSDMPEEIKTLLRKEGGNMAGGTGSTYEEGETNDAETKDHDRTGFAQNTQYAKKEKALNAELALLTKDEKWEKEHRLRYEREKKEKETDEMGLGNPDYYSKKNKKKYGKGQNIPQPYVTTDYVTGKDTVTGGKGQWQGPERALRHGRRKDTKDDPVKAAEWETSYQKFHKFQTEQSTAKHSKEAEAENKKRNEAANPEYKYPSGDTMREQKKDPSSDSCPSCGKSHPGLVHENKPKDGDDDWENPMATQKSFYKQWLEKKVKRPSPRTAHGSFGTTQSAAGQKVQSGFSDATTSAAGALGVDFGTATKAKRHVPQPKATKFPDVKDRKSPVFEMSEEQRKEQEEYEKKETKKSRAFRKLKPVYEGDTKEAEKSDVEHGNYGNVGREVNTAVSTDTNVDVTEGTGYEERPHISLEDAGKLPRSKEVPYSGNEVHVSGDGSKDEPKFSQPHSQETVRKVGIPEQHPNTYGMRYGMKGGVKKVWCPEHQVWEETTKDWHE